ncbi:DNA helicase RecQ [Thalassotalea psychrophila]|uniref:DNA helicase RecQ n=1 Tax=Thalassotalea psychrophila TaxID=3065647 RepID=A0ABY9TQF1_9GAMM|nr:DNA helicase RecQ [Colwelliaceae bacterium SQ149]
MNNTPLNILNNVFGYSQFRHQQAQIIDDVLAGNDVFNLMPTGGGKSLCYQIPSLVLNGVGIVVSPLIALMQDQVNALTLLGIKAAFLNSTQDYATQQTIEQQLINNDIDILYVAPERLLMEKTLSLLERINIALFAIDEAHCVSQWGHDFRPEYQQLSLLRQRFPNVATIALTATADERTREEIINVLGLTNAQKFVHSFDRPNIQYRIHQNSVGKEGLLRFINDEHPNDCGIVYCLSRKSVESTAAWLASKGKNALPYHAKLPTTVKEDHLNRFLREDNVIIVATIAFGMGIDKPNVRFVAHLNLPKNIEAYYQETGRAGRDGLPSTAWMSYRMQDVIQLRQMTESSQGSELFKQVTQRKLNALLGYCEVSDCRRKAILNYFSEDYSAPCGNCDNCLNPPKTFDGTLAAKKALSTVYRSEQSFGALHQVDILLGKTNEKITRFNHQNLSVFGIGKEHTDKEWQGVFRQLVAMGYLGVDLQYGALKLTEKSRDILQDKTQIQFREIPKTVKQPKTKKAPKQHIDLSTSDNLVFEQLRDLRTTWAKEKGVPAYVIFHDATLKALAQKKPTTMDELKDISGIGCAKAERYGAEVVKVIKGL